MSGSETPAPRVSVVVPNYNHARYLRNRLITVLEQTYQDFELLYLDDASTDSSSDVFAEFSNHPKIRSIVNPSNSGSAFAQWNRGVQEARGEFVWIAEADDYADPSFLATLVERLEAHPSAGIAYCQSSIVDSADIVTDRFPNGMSRWREAWMSDFVRSGREVCAKFLLFENYLINASAMVFRKSAYVAAGYADETMRVCGDWLTYAKLLSQSDLIYVALPLNFFRSHGNTVRSTTSLLAGAREAAIVRSFIQAKIAATEGERARYCSRYLRWKHCRNPGQKMRSPAERFGAYCSCLELDSVAISSFTRARLSIYAERLLRKVRALGSR